MEPKKDGCSDSVDFNYELFTINGKPLKFSLNGFGLEDFMGFTAIIEAFGGQLSDPRSPGTLIFSDCNHSRESSYNRYDIRFLRDSIAIQTLQKLENYRIPPVANRRPRNFPVEREPSNANNVVQEPRNKGRDNEEYDTSNSAENESSESKEFDGETVTRKVDAKLGDCSSPPSKADRISHKCFTQSNLKGAAESAKNANRFGNINNNGTVELTALHEKEPQESRKNQISSVEYITPEASTFGRTFTKAQRTIQKNAHKQLSPEKTPQSVSMPGFGIQKSLCLRSYKIPRMKRKNPKKSTVKSASTGREQKVKDNETLIISNVSNEKTQTIDRTEMINSLTSQHVEQEAPDNDENTNEESLSTASEESELSDGGLSDESYTTRQLRELENYQILSSSRQSVETSTIDDNSADEPSKTYSLHDNKKHKFSENEGTCSAARVRVYKVKAAKTINEVESNKRDITKPVNDDSNTSRQKRKCSSSSKRDESVEDMKTSKSFSFASLDSDSKEEYNLRKRLRGGRRRQAKKYSIRLERYSREDSRRMIQYLIDNNAIDRAGEPAIWETFKAENVLNKKDTTVKRLHAHFVNKLQKNFRKYTDNPAAIKEFEKLLNRELNPERQLYSEEDNRRMIQYLIDNNAINRGAGVLIWRAFLQENVLDKKLATAEKLCSHFKTPLKNNFRKYTDDPDAIQEFEKRNARKLTKKNTRNYGNNCKYSEEDNRRMIQYLIKNNVIHLGRTTQIWKPFLAKNVLDYKGATAKTLRMHFSISLRKIFSKYTDNPTAIREFERLNARVVTQKIRRYSDEDNRRLIKYLFDNNAIHLGRTVNIWRSFLKENVLDDKGRSDKALRLHFVNRLQKHFRRYTDNPAVIREFEKLNAQTSDKQFRYTEEDDRRMIQYLIDNNAIHLAKGVNIWKSFLAENTLSNNRVTTASNLSAHVRLCLIHRCRKYVDDPKILRAFEKLRVA